MSLARRGLGVLALAVAMVVATATPAAAHSVQGAGPTNYLSG